MDFLTEATNLKEIYKDMEIYQNLSEGDKEFFDNLFPFLLVFPDLTMSNKEIAERLNKYCRKKKQVDKPLSVSIVEKRIRHLKHAGLIVGREDREFNSVKRHWTTVKRHLSLDAELFTFMRIKEQDRRILSARLAASNKDIEEQHPELKKISKEPEEPPPTQKYKVEVRFE